jgi:hypothetical protein
MNGRAPLCLTLVAAILLVMALMVLQPYSVTPRWRVYTGPAQRFLRAALREDSVALARQSASASPVAWALRAARRHPQSLAVWAREADAWSGAKWGDTAEVVFRTQSDVCSRSPIWIRFAGSGNDALVLQVSSACFGGE